MKYWKERKKLPVQSDTVEKLRLWFMQCPAISANSRFTIDYLGADKDQYAIYLTPTTLKSTIDILGDVWVDDLQEMNFVFASVAVYGVEVLQNLQNLGFFDEIIDWMIKQNRIKNFPDISQGRILSIMPLTNQYLLEADANYGRYQIQCNLKYYRKGVE